MLKICRGAKFKPSVTWKLKPPDIAPVENKNVSLFLYYSVCHIQNTQAHTGHLLLLATMKYIQSHPEAIIDQYLCILIRIK